MLKLFHWKLKKELLDKGYFKYIFISLIIISAIGISYVSLNYKKSIYRFEQPRVNIVNNVFASYQNPIIDISTYYDTTTLGKVLGISDPPNIPVIKNLIDSQGDRVENAKLELESNGKYKLVLPENRGIRPGKYVVEIEYGTKSFTSEFYWGVLSINTHKSVYELNEEAKIYLGVLNKDGHTICDANLTLTVLTPTAKVLTPKVHRSDQCFGDNVTTIPDYSAKLKVDEIGKYKMILKNIDTGYQMEDFFDVVESVDISIERKGPTRIYPYVPYPMSIIVKSKKDFHGTLIETVPSGFKIKGYTKFENGRQIIEFDADLKAGESKTFEYFFDAPDISPEYYFLGPVQIGDFKESRVWQIASDADGSGTNTVNPTAVNQSSTGNTLTFTVTAAETMNSGEVAIKVPTSEGWSTPQSSSGTKGYTTASFSGSGGLADELYQFEGGSWKADDNDTCNVAVDGALGLVPDTTIVYEGDASVTCNNTGNTGPDGTDSFGVDWATAQDWSSISAITFQFRVSVDTTAGILQAAIDDNIGCDSPIEEYDMPAISAGSWTQVTWTFSGAGSTRTGVRTFCINANSTGLDSRQVWLDDLRISGGAQLSDADTVVDADDNDTCNVVTSGELGIVMDTTTVKQGGASITCNNTANTGPDAGDSFGIKFAPNANWQNYTKVGYWIRSSANTASTDIDIAIDDNYGCASPIEEGDVPALTANTWTFATWTFSGAGSTRTSVRTLCWNAAVSSPGLDSKQIWVDEVLIGPGSLKFVENGSDIDIMARLFTMANGEVLTITYGSGGGSSGADAPSSAGASTFTTRTRIDSGGTLTSIASSPVVTINSANITISGVIKQADESSAYDCSTNNITVHASVNGGSNVSTTCTESSGAFSITVGPPASGNPVVVYIDSMESISATTVTLANTGNISNLDLYVDRLILTHENSGPITNAHLATGDNGDAGIRYTVSSGHLTTESNIEIHVKSGKTYDPGGTITTQGSGGLHLDDGPSTTAYLDTESNSIAGDITVDTNAILYADSTTSVGGGDITVNGILTYSTGTPTITLSSTGTISGSGATTFYTLGISNNAITTIARSININSGNLITTGTGSIGYSGTPTVTLTGEGTLGGGTGAITFYDLALSGPSQTTTLSTNGLVISNSLNIGSSHVFAMGTNSVTLGSTSMAGSGDLTIASGASTSQSGGTFTVFGNTTSPDWSGPGTLTVFNFTIGDGTNSIILDNETADVPLNIHNDFTITASSTYQASSTASLKVGGSYTNNGTFTANQSTMEFNANYSDNTLSGAMTGSSAFYELKFNNASGSWSINNNVVTTNFSIASATEVIAPMSLTVSGSFTGNSSFTHNSGLVTLNGASTSTQSVIGSTTFYDLTATASGNRIIEFTNSTTTRITNNLTLTGTNCDALLILRSNSKGNSWSLDDDIGGITTVSYVDVQDSNAIDQALSASNSVNSGRNSNWTISASACEGASTVTTPTSYSFQRKTFFDETNNIYWLAYHDGDEIEFKYSNDVGSNWEAASNGHIAYDTNDFSLWRATISSTEYVFLVVKDGYDVKLRVGTLSSNNITWDNDIDTVFDGTGTSDSYAYPYVALDSSNYIWVGARYYDGTNYVYKVVDSTSTGDTDLSTLSWNTPKQISANQTNSNVYGNIVSIGSQDMYATFAVGTELKGCLWDDSQGRWENSTDQNCEFGTSGETAYFSSLENNLVGYWKMNENSWNGTTGEVLDETANNLDGTRIGNATTTNSGFTRAGTFDGTGDAVTIVDPGTDSIVDFSNTDSVTFSAWVKPTSMPSTSDFDTILSKASSSGAGNYFLQYQGNGAIQFCYSDTTPTFRCYLTDSSGLINTNGWSHVVFQFTYGNHATAKIFHNGTLIPGTWNGSSLTPFESNDEVYIGGINGNIQNINGLIDEVRIYNSLISTEDISKLYELKPDLIKVDDSSDFGPMSGSGRQLIRTTSGNLYSFQNDNGNCEMWKSVDGINLSQMQSGTNITCDSTAGIAMALDFVGFIHVVYENGSSSLKYRMYNTNTDSWDSGIGEENIFSGDTINNLAIAVDSNNKPHIVTRKILAGTVTYYHRVTNSWSSAVDIISASVTDYFDISMNEDNLPVVATINSNALHAWLGNQNAATSFSDSGIIDSSINTTNNQAGVSIAVDEATGNEWIAFVDSGSTISLAKHTGAIWNSNWTTVTTKTDLGYEPSIAIAWSNRIYVFYQEDSADSKVVYDVYQSGAASPSWVGETILYNTTGVDYSDIKARWGYSQDASYSEYLFDIVYSDGTDVYYGNFKENKWLTGWTNRVPITISHTNIDSNLTHFPVLISLGSSVGIANEDLTAIFDEVTSNSQKIAITKGDGTSELFAEIEEWDSSAEQAKIWVSKDDFTLLGNSDTTLYLYYDNEHTNNTDYVGGNDSVPAQKVWNGDYRLVQHLEEGTTGDTDYKDSTVNNNDSIDVIIDGTGSNPSASGIIAGAVDFDGVDDRITITENGSLDMQSEEALTLEAWVNGVELSGWEDIIVKTDQTFDADYYLTTVDDEIIFGFYSSGYHDHATTTANLSTSGGWYHISATFNQNTNEVNIYVNGVNVYNNTSETNDLVSSDGNTYIGAGFYGENSPSVIDEVRISRVARSASWIKADYYNGSDNIIDWGTIESLLATTPAYQDTIDTIPSNINDNFSTVSDSNGNVHIAYIDDETTDQVSYRKWMISTKTWGSATLVPSSASETQTSVSIAINQSSADLDDLYVSWIDSSNSRIYYRQYDSSATTWQTVQDWITTGTNLKHSLNYGNDGRIFALWTQGNSAPTTVNWGSIKAPTGGNSPIVTSVLLNNGETITLTEGTTTSISWTATVTDADGYTNISSVTGKAYRSGVANANNCTPNDANCYYVASCNVNNCSGNSCTATCTANFQFFTDATDTGSTYEAQYWRAWVQATDANTNTGEGFSAINAPDVASTAGLEITSSITYGALLAGDDTGSSPKTTTVTNTGNTILDLEVSGTSLCINYPTCSGPTIAVGYQEYHTNTFTYGSGIGLTLSPSSVQFDLNKATQNPSNSTATMFWGLGVPNPKEDGSYTGVNTVSAVNGGS